MKKKEIKLDKDTQDKGELETLLDNLLEKLYNNNNVIIEYSKFYEEDNKERNIQ